MKKIILTTAIVLMQLLMHAQVPQLMNYQGIARDVSGKAFANKTMQLKISIIDGAENGKVIYQETHETITNNFGLYTLKIGAGNSVIGVFTNIDWAGANKYTKVELLENNHWIDLGVTQLLSVPYAMYAQQAGNSVLPTPKVVRGGTANFLSKFDATGSSSAEVNSQLWDNGTSIGVNTLAPQAKMHVFQNAPSSNILVMESQDSTGFGRFSLWNDKGFPNRATFTRYGSKNTSSQPGSTLFPNADLLAFGCNKGSFLISTAGDAGIQVVNAGLVKLRLMVEDSTGNVGIGGNAFPQNTLHINSETTNDTVRITNATTGNTKNDGMLIGNNGNASFIINKENSTLNIGTNNVNQINILPTGEVGIGTVTPTSKLEVAGQIKITGGAPANGKLLTSDASGLASWQTPAAVVNSLNGAIGAVSNSVTLGTAGTNPNIVGSGTNTVTVNLPIASAINTGVISNSSFISFTNKLEGGGTTNFLQKSLSANTIGNSQIEDNGNQVIVGSGFPSNLTHKLNVRGNDSAIRVIGTGSFLSQAQINFGDANYVYIKEDIDDRLQIHASNRVNFTGGNVGIDVLNPDAKLDVNGQIKIRGGAPAAGKVLTSDASGLASWQLPTGGGDTNWKVSSPGNIYANAQHVGINQTTPQYALEVSDTTGTVASIGNYGSQYSNNGILQVFYDGNTLQDHIAINANSLPGNSIDAFGIGVKGQGGYIGGYFVSMADDALFSNYGSFSNGTNNYNTIGAGAYAQNFDNPNSAGTKIGLEAAATNGAKNYGVDAYANTIASTDSGVAVRATANGVGNNVAIYASATGANSKAGRFIGNVDVVGNLSKSGGTFKIDHPADPANKYLIHSFVESPDMMNVYNGNTTTGANGEIIVQLPTYFEAENKDFRYQLTVVGKDARVFVMTKIANNQFAIKTSEPYTEVSWQVTGIRNDAWANANRVVPEVQKTVEEKGKYLHPQLFNSENAIDPIPQKTIPNMENKIKEKNKK
jgi:hypothetical protein